MIKTTTKILLFFISITLIFSNSRVAFSRPGSVLRTPGSSHFDENVKPPLLTVGFSSEIANFDLPSGSTSIYLQTKTKSGNTMRRNGKFKRNFYFFGFSTLPLIQNNFIKKQEYPRFPYPTQIKNEPREINSIMINSAGFGGNHTSLIISKF